MTTTRDRERLDADAMNAQRVDDSVAPVTGASEGGEDVPRRSRPCGQIGPSASAGARLQPAEASLRRLRETTKED